MPPPESTALDFTGLVQRKGISSHQADPQELLGEWGDTRRINENR